MDEIKKIAIRDTKDFVDIICKGMSENDANETLDSVKSALNTDGNILGISKYNEGELYNDCYGHVIRLNTLYPELKKAFMSDDTEKTLMDTSSSFKIETANVLNMNMVSIENGNILFVSLDDFNKLKSMDVIEIDFVEGEPYGVSHMLNSTDLNIKAMKLVDNEEIELDDEFFINIDDEFYFEFEAIEDMKVKLFVISNVIHEEEEEVISEEELERQKDIEDYFKPTDFEQKSGTYKVGNTKKNYYDEVISKGIKDEYKSIEFVLDGGFNMLKSGSVYMNEEDARLFYPLKERLNKEQGTWVISGGQDTLPHIEISLLGHLEKEEMC